MRHHYFVADVFTDTPLEGNQVAVFDEASRIDADLMQATAREMRLAETVFVLDPDHGGDALVRIFTPQAELPFAGHPILGTAFVLGSTRDQLRAVRLETGAGTITVELERDSGGVVFGRMDQPIPTPRTYENPDRLLAALGVAGSELPIDAYRNGPDHVYVALQNEDAVASVRPDMQALSDLGDIGANCFAGSGSSWKTRMFAPAIGVPEDAATGSAAGPLAVHLARHGRIAYGDEIEIRQGSEIQRPSLIHACAHGSAEQVERVVVGGSAVIVAEGQYRLG
ncbi:MAG: PhzF family phenazine biosynthesis protein [Acidimicrobiales bacterium]